jgi:hypothetical protein
MAYIRDYDPDAEREEQLAAQADLSAIYCPRCGCNDVQVIRRPTASAPRQTAGKWQGGWFTSEGSGQCNDCGAKFPIEMIEDADLPERWG